MHLSRAKHNGEWVPGKITLNHNCIYVPWGDQEHSYKEYEVLQGKAGTYFSLKSVQSSILSGAAVQKRA